MNEDNNKVPSWVPIAIVAVLFIITCVILMNINVSRDPDCHQDFNGCVR